MTAYETGGFLFYPSYYETVKLLDDSTRLDLFDAIVSYAFEGQIPEKTSNLVKAFMLNIVPNIDANIKRRKNSHENGSKNGGKNGRDEPSGNPARTQNEPSGNPARTQSSDDIEEEKEEEKELEVDTDKEADPDKEPLASEPASEELPFGDAPSVQAAFDEWLSYKEERGETYRPTGLKSLITTVRQKISQYGESAVIDAIRESAASGYKGIAWSKAEEKSKHWSFEDLVDSVGRGGNHINIMDL